MTTQTLTLADFLLARIAEDEAPSWVLEPYTCKPGCCAPAGWVGHRCLICGDPTSYGGTVAAITGSAEEHAEQVHRRSRVLAECEAKRRRVDLFSQWDRSCPPDDWPDDGDMSMAPMSDAGRYLLRIEALPYASHPDYRDEWHP